MTKTISMFVVPFIIALFISSPCKAESGNMNSTHNFVEKIPYESWENLSTKRILFGHHSVGRNILEGVDAALSKSARKILNIVEIKENSVINEGVIAHFSVGQNRDPVSKNKSFYDTLHVYKNHKIDIALFKYCYVDFNENTDTESLFKDYEEKMNQLKVDFPETIFIHTTVPLRTTDLKYNWGLWYEQLKKTKYWKAKLERLLNFKIIFQSKENIKRHEFSELLRNKYAGKEPIFDIARIEATYPNGKVNLSERRGREYLSLVPEYSRDGGHLNEKGKERLATDLLSMLVSLSK